MPLRLVDHSWLVTLHRSMLTANINAFSKRTNRHHHVSMIRESSMHHIAFTALSKPRKSIQAVELTYYMLNTRLPNRRSQFAMSQEGIQILHAYRRASKSTQLSHLERCSTKYCENSSGMSSIPSNSFLTAQLQVVLTMQLPCAGDDISAMSFHSTWISCGGR